MSSTFWQDEQSAQQTAQDNFWGSNTSQNHSFWEDETQHQVAQQTTEDFWSEEDPTDNVEETSALDLIDTAIELLEDSQDDKDLALMNALVSIADLYQS